MRALTLLKAVREKLPEHKVDAARGKIAVAHFPFAFTNGC